MKGKSGKYSRSLQHDTAHTGHGAQAVCGVLDGQSLILKVGNKREISTKKKHKNSIKLNVWKLEKQALSFMH